uniref:Uncharacterized protein n=1 Tax=Anas platyrhynchos TaxID=8839 RepID=A0A8B9R269_ANAPL
MSSPALPTSKRPPMNDLSWIWSPRPYIPRRKPKNLLKRDEVWSSLCLTSGNRPSLKGPDTGIPVGATDSSCVLPVEQAMGFLPPTLITYSLLAPASSSHPIYFCLKNKAPHQHPNLPTPPPWDNQGSVRHLELPQPSHPTLTPSPTNPGDVVPVSGTALSSSHFAASSFAYILFPPALTKTGIDPLFRSAHAHNSRSCRPGAARRCFSPNPALAL